MIESTKNKRNKLIMDQRSRNNADVPTKSQWLMSETQFFWGLCWGNQILGFLERLLWSNNQSTVDDVYCSKPQKGFLGMIFYQLLFFE
jgi:hypothetical protein